MPSGVWSRVFIVNWNLLGIDWERMSGSEMSDREILADYLESLTYDELEDFVKKIPENIIQDIVECIQWW